MAMRNCLLPIVVAAAAALPPAAHAEPCMVLASAKVSYRADGAARSGKRLVEDCRSVASIDGELSVCFVDRQRERTCPKLGPGQKFDDVAGDSRPGARLPASMRKIADLVSGTQAVVGVAGVKRAHDGERWPGFPYGAVRSSGGGVRVAPAGVTQVDLFSLEPEDRSRGAPLVLRAQAAPFDIPAGALAPGASYKWQAQVGAERVTGGFQVLAAEFAADVARRVAAIESNAQLAPEAKLFMLAEVYEDFGLVGERDAALAQLRQGS
jgi:hypothetical protein